MEPITTELRAELGRAARAYGVDEVTAALVNDHLGAIDAVHEGLERESESLRRELDRVLGELDEMHKTDGISDNTGGFMQNAERSIGSAVITITPTLDWSGVARELRSIADTLAGDAE